MNKNKGLFKKTWFVILAIVLVGQTMVFSFPARIYAASGSLSSLSDTMSNQTPLTASSHMIEFATSVSIQGAGDTITITFPTDFTFTAKSISSVSFTHGAVTGQENTETLADVPSTTNWGAVFSSTNNQIFTLTAPTDGVGATTIEANDKLIIVFDATSNSNPSTTGNYVIGISIAGSNTASGQIAVPITTNDQIAINAAVDPILSFSISNASVGFSHLSTASVRWATADQNGATSEPANGNPTSLTGATNASAGWSTTIQDVGNGATASLYSVTASDYIPAVASNLITTGGAKQYGAYGKNASSGVTIAPGFDDGADAVSISTSSQLFASTAAPSNDLSVDIALKATIDPLTKAGNYTDTITVICTGNY